MKRPQSGGHTESVVRGGGLLLLVLMVILSVSGCSSLLHPGQFTTLTRSELLGQWEQVSGSSGNASGIGVYYTFSADDSVTVTAPQIDGPLLSGTFQIGSHGHELIIEWKAPSELTGQVQWRFVSGSSSSLRFTTSGGGDLDLTEAS